MNPIPLDKQLLRRLQDIPEIEHAGFSARGGLTGAGVTVLKGRGYFGSWRLTGGVLVWNQASAHTGNHFEETVDGAAYYTALQILKNLETGRDTKIAALAG